MSSETITPTMPMSSHDELRPVTKIAVVLRDDLATWQSLNVTAFLTSGIAAARPGLMGEPYVDADDTTYLPLFGQPVMIFASAGDMIREIHSRAVRRELDLSVFTADMFATGNDIDNRRVVRAVGHDDLDLVGLAIHGPRNAVDKTVKGATLHP